MEKILKERGWELWARGGECYFESGDDRVIASAEIDGHAEGLPREGQPVLVALYESPIGPEVTALLGGYEQLGPTVHVTVTWQEFLIESARRWHRFLRAGADRLRAERTG